MTNSKNVNMVIQLNGKDGVFRVEKEMTIFRHHVTQNEWKDIRKAVKSQINAMLKHGQVSIDIYYMPEYSRKDYVRFFVSNWENTIDYRNFNGIDYADSTIHQFPTKVARAKFIMNTLDTCFADIVGNIPESESFYRATLEV